MEVGLITVRKKIYENWKFNEYLLMGWSECHTYIVDTSMIYRVTVEDVLVLWNYVHCSTP